MKKRNLLFLVVSIFVTGLAAFFVYSGNQDVVKTKTNYAKASIGIPDDPAGRLEYTRKMLADPTTGKIPENIRQKELKFASNLPKTEDVALAKGKGIKTLTWSKRGPINRGGRTRALAIDIRTQTAPNITIIAGGTSGGIYKSTDNGVTWVNKLSPSTIHSITSIAQNTRTGQEDIWYVGTGESFGSAQGGGGATFFGDGIYKSTDNGETWALLAFTSDGNVQSFNSPWRFVNNIAINKTTGTIYAAASNAVYSSLNGGVTWSTARSSFASTTMSDVQITSSGVIYTTIPSGFTDEGISRSPDDGTTWTNITPAGFPTVYRRSVIGIAPSNENIVYFWVYTPGQGTTQTQLWKYTYLSGDGSGTGGSWINLTAQLPVASGVDTDDGTDVQGSYNMVIKVKPDEANFVIIGGTNLYRSLDGFSTLVPSTGGTNWIGGYALTNNSSDYANHHPDQHALVFLNSNPKVLYSGSDGGVSVTTDVTAANVTWSDLNTGYITSQFYAIDIDPNTSGDPVIVGGLQDNGSYATFSNNFNTPWVVLDGGDGAFSAVRKTGANEYTVYVESQNGDLSRGIVNSAGIPQSGASIVPFYTGQFAFVNPFVLDANNSSIMYFAQGDSVIRNNNVDTLTVPQAWNVMGNATTGSSVTALATSKSPANILFVGGSNGKILKITGADVGDPVAIDISTGKGMPAAFVVCIAVDPLDANNIIAVFSNYSVKSLWASGDGGATWSDISGNLEQNADGSGNGPSTRWLTSVTVGGQTVFYVATSTGLYSTSTLNGTSTVWAQEGSTTIGNVVVTMVKGRDVDGYVVAGTHGMGVYSATQIVTGIENKKSIPTNFTLSQNYPNPFNPSTIIAFSLPQANNVILTLYDALGKKVRDIVNKNFSAGNHSVNFNASNLASGVYFYRIQADNFVQTKKMILLR